MLREVEWVGQGDGVWGETRDESAVVYTPQRVRY